MTRHQPIHGDEHGQVCQGHGGDYHQRPGVLAQFGGSHALRGRTMQDDDERYRTEKEQGRDQDQPYDQEVEPTPGWIFGTRIDLGERFRRRLYLQFGKRLIW